MLDKPMKRIYPSLIASTLAKTARQSIGLKKGSTPSSTNIKASAPRSMSDTAVLPLISSVLARLWNPNHAWL